MDRTEQLKASPPLFESPLLDRFTRVHPVVPLLIYVPVILALALTGAERVGATTTLGLLLGGYAVWTLTEYWLHRVVFTSSRSTASARGCTGCSTASITSIPTTRCGS